MRCGDDALAAGLHRRRRRGGARLADRRLASLQLTLVVVDLLVEALAWLVPFGALVLAGFWTFVYNLARTMAPLETYDVTERHFLYALGVVGLASWALATLPAWVRAPTAPEYLLGATGSAHLLVFGAIGFVVFGTLDPRAASASRG